MLLKIPASAVFTSSQLYFPKYKPHSLIQHFERRLKAVFIKLLIMQGKETLFFALWRCSTFSLSRVRALWCLERRAPLTCKNKVDPGSGGLRGYMWCLLWRCLCGAASDWLTWGARSWQVFGRGAPVWPCADLVIHLLGAVGSVCGGPKTCQVI